MSAHPSLLRRAARTLLRAWLRPEVEGAEHVPATGPVIIAATHRSHADSVALGIAVRRPLRFLGTEELVGWPVVGRWLPAFGMVPIRRGVADQDALDRIAALLEAGEAVVLYPEGSRSRDGRVHRLRSGVARIAAASGAPVVPCGLLGTAVAWPPGSRPRLRPTRVGVRFGRALAPPAPEPVARRRFTDDLHLRLATLAGAPRTRTFAAAGGGRP